ncbi:MAG: hypothetical protein ABIW19_14790 [Vicinamibacterales bacterium]
MTERFTVEAPFKRADPGFRSRPLRESRAESVSEPIASMVCDSLDAPALERVAVAAQVLLPYQTTFAIEHTTTWLCSMAPST